MNRNNDLDLEQQLPSVQLERGKSSETDFAEGDIENLEIYKLHTNAINQLVQMGYSLRAALLCVQITKSSAIEVNINFALMDERGVYTHPFLEKGTKKLCIICNDDQSKHDREADPKFFEKDRKTVNTHKGTVDKIGPKLGGSSSNYLRKSYSTPAFDNNSPKIEAPKPISRIPKDPVTCSVCYEQVEREEIVRYNEVPHDICKPCFVEYLSTQINQNKVVKIVCPHCSEVLYDDTIKKIISGQLYKKYQKFLKNIKVNSDPLCKWCPNPKCSEVVVLEKENAEKGKCQHCGLEICGKCGQKYHSTDISCEKYVTLELKKWKLSHDSANCPKCKMIVEKESGCNHMTCPVCYYEWCWLCNTAYTKYHYKNPFGCLGLQGGGNKKKDWTTWKRYLRIFLIILALPILLVFGIPVYMTKRMLEETCGRKHDWLGGCLLLPTFLLGFILSGLLIVFLPLIALRYLIGYCYEREKLRKRSASRLKKMREETKTRRTRAKDTI